MLKFSITDEWSLQSCDNNASIDEERGSCMNHACNTKFMSTPAVIARLYLINLVKLMTVEWTDKILKIGLYRKLVHSNKDHVCMSNIGKILRAPVLARAL